jgi:hypothetical protein
MSEDDQQPEDEQQHVARLIADAEEQVRLTMQWGRLMTAIEREQFTGPVHAAHYAGERAYHVARTAAEHAGALAEEAHARGMRAFWYGYFTDLAAEAAARADLARAVLRQHGEEGDSPLS